MMSVQHVEDGCFHTFVAFLGPFLRRTFVTNFSTIVGNRGKLFRADFWEGDEDNNFSVSESGGSVNGPNLFTELPFL